MTSVPDARKRYRRGDDSLHTLICMYITTQKIESDKQIRACDKDRERESMTE